MEEPAPSVDFESGRCPFGCHVPLDQEPPGSECRRPGLDTAAPPFVRGRITGNPFGNCSLPVFITMDRQRFQYEIELMFIFYGGNVTC
jgi:hypothetical protein